MKGLKGYDHLVFRDSDNKSDCEIVLVQIGVSASGNMMAVTAIWRRLLAFAAFAPAILNTRTITVPSVQCNKATAKVSRCVKTPTRQLQAATTPKDA